MNGCLFCKIVDGEAPADIVHSGERILAIRDIRPMAPTHLLLIPKEHVTSVRELDGGHADMLAELMRAATHLARAEGIDRSGWRLVSNVGAEGGQTVQHLHFHLLGGRQMHWPPG